MTARPGYPPVPISGDISRDPTKAANIAWVRRIADAVNLYILKGKLNCVLEVTLTANSTTTLVEDARISVFSTLILQPLTAHAAAAQYETPYILPTLQNSGEVTFVHANNAQTDRTFNMTIIG